MLDFDEEIQKFQQMTHVPSVVQMSLYTKRLPGFQIYITTKVLRKPV